jgi:hypothetical protein
LHTVNNNTTAWVDKNAIVTATTTTAGQWQYDTKEVYFDSDIEHLVTGDKPYRLDKKLKVIEEYASETRDVIIDGVNMNMKLDEIMIEHKMNPTLVMKAQNHVQTIQLAGAQASESGSGGTSVGGTFTMLDRTNKAVAGIADGAVITSKSLDVYASNKEWSLTVAPTAGMGEGIGANAMVAYTKLDQTALSSISREAQVTVTDALDLKADLVLWNFGVAGAVTVSTGSGVGIGVAMNEVKGNTKAYIGDNDSDAGGANTTEGSAGFVKSAELAVLAESIGKVG